MEKKLVVITGASSGIGEAAAKRFSSLGHPTLLLARRLDRLESFNLPNSMSLKVDVTNKEEFAQAIEKAEAKYGPTDLLINNAGVMLLKNKMWEQDTKELIQNFEVNVFALLYGMQIVLPNMTANKTGTIINISSVAGKILRPERVSYSGSKFAVNAISEMARLEAAPFNVRVITIAPGVVETELLSHTSDAAIKEQYEKLRQTVITKILNPLDVVNAMVYAYSQPQDICVREIVLSSTMQPF